MKSDETTTATAEAPPVHKPSQASLPGFSDEQAEEIAGVAEFYERTERAAKKAVRDTKLREETKIADAARQVQAVLEKYGRTAVSINGWTISIVDKGRKVIVKGAKKRKPKKEKAAAPPPAPRKSKGKKQARRA